MIGIAITTHNRREIALQTIAAVLQFSPPETLIWVVDDGSAEAFTHDSRRIHIWRNEQPQGIARAKNRCFELLADCDHLFLMDDDCRPIHARWLEFYIEAARLTGAHHFSLSRRGKCRSNPRLGSMTINGVQISRWKWPCGACQYYTAHCLKTAGGCDTRYARWGYEHVGLSARIHNMGLTPDRYIDVCGSADYVRMLDEDPAFERTVDQGERYRYLASSRWLLREEEGSSDWKPYRA